MGGPESSSLLPHGLEPTPEEQLLLGHYETVKLYEKEAAKLREKAALAKLREASEKHRSAKSSETSSSFIRPKKTKGKKRAKREGEDYDEEMEGSSGEGSEGDEDEDEEGSDLEEDMLHRRREEKLEQMREDVEMARRREEANQKVAEEEARAMHLAEGADATDLGPLLKRRVEDRPAASLISSLEAQAATPPHEFSKSLELKRGLAGAVLFPKVVEPGVVSSWSPPATASHCSEGCLEIELPDFDVSQAQMGSGNNTIALKFMAPTKSSRFSFNIAAPNHRDYFDVLFHFNPRQHQKGGQLIINNKQEGIWGQGIAVPLATLPLIFGQTSVTLIIQIHGDGFDVFLEKEKKHCARLEHRSQWLSTFSGKISLFLQFPSTDDYGNPEDWTVYKVWWGHKPLMASADSSNVPGVNVVSGLHPRKLFVSGLERISTEAELELRRAELERAFRKYGGAQGVTATVPLNSTFAFVECESERKADLALTEMQSKYRLNRARRSRAEALAEEKLAQEKAAAGNKAESSEWD